MNLFLPMKSPLLCQLQPRPLHKFLPNANSGASPRPTLREGDELRQVYPLAKAVLLKPQGEAAVALLPSLRMLQEAKLAADTALHRQSPEAAVS